MYRKLILVVALAGVAALSACGKKPGEEYVGSWNEGNNKAPLVIARAGDGFDITQPGDNSHAFHGQYQDGRIKISSKNGSMVLAYDKQQDVINYFIGAMPIGMLKRVK
jgi:hypothetical protein